MLQKTKVERTSRTTISELITRTRYSPNHKSASGPRNRPCPGWLIDSEANKNHSLSDRHGKNTNIQISIRIDLRSLVTALDEDARADSFRGHILRIERYALSVCHVTRWMTHTHTHAHTRGGAHELRVLSGNTGIFGNVFSALNRTDQMHPIAVTSGRLTWPRPVG